MPFAVTLTLNLFVLKACASAVSAHASAVGSRKVTLHSRLQKITKIYMSTNFSLELLANDDFGFPSSLRSVTIN